MKEQTSSPKLTKEQILFALDKFRKLDLTIEANKERLIDSLVKCIILYDDKLVITFNFKNEPVTVPTSDELEAIEDGSDTRAFALADRTRNPTRLTLGVKYSIINSRKIKNSTRDPYANKKSCSSAL